MHKLILTARRHSTMAASALLIGASLTTLGACSDDELAAPRASVRLPSVTITPGPVTLRAGGTQQYTAVVKSPTGQEISGAAVTWSTADQAVARVSSTGLVTVVAPGTAGITARYENVQSVVSVTVIGAVAGVTVSAPQTTLAIGNSVQLNTQALDGAGVPQPREVTYASSAPAVAVVSSTGLVTAVGAGTTSITATSEGRSGSVNITVTAPIPVVLSPASSFFAQGLTQQLTAVVRDPVTGAINATPTITYASSNTAVATVNATGLVSLVGGGTATITGTSGAFSGTATVSNVLTNNTPVIIAGALNSSLSYYANVPAGSTRLTITLANSNADDADIEVYAPGVTAFVCESGNGGSNESCVINNPVAGLYRIRVIGFSVYSNVTMRAVVVP